MYIIYISNILYVYIYHITNIYNIHHIYIYIYVFAPQGRLGGLQSLHIDQARDMIQQGYAVSDTFKTASKYGYQPILLPADIHWLFQLYLKVICIYGYMMYIIYICNILYVYIYHITNIYNIHIIYIYR